MDELTHGLKNVSMIGQVESLHINDVIYDDNISESLASNQSVEAPDMDQSFDVKPEIVAVDLPTIYPEVPPPANQPKEKKAEVRVVKHRNTGKIGIGNLHRRRALSMSADSAAEYFQRLKESRNSNRPNRPVRQATRTPMRVTSTMVRLTVDSRARANSIEVNNQTPTAPVVFGSNGMDSNIKIEPRAASPNQQQSGQQQHQLQQQQQPSQQLQELIRLMQSDKFCAICQQTYASRQTMAKHLKSQKHQQNNNNMDATRKRLLELAYTKLNANRANPQ